MKCLCRPRSFFFCRKSFRPYLLCLLLCRYRKLSINTHFSLAVGFEARTFGGRLSYMFCWQIFRSYLLCFSFCRYRKLSTNTHFLLVVGFEAHAPGDRLSYMCQRGEKKICGSFMTAGLLSLSFLLYKFTCFCARLFTMLLIFIFYR